MKTTKIERKWQMRPILRMRNPRRQRPFLKIATRAHHRVNVRRLGIQPQLRRPGRPLHGSPKLLNNLTKNTYILKHSNPS